MSSRSCSRPILNRYLADLGPNAPVGTLTDVIAFNEQRRAEELPSFDHDVLLKAPGKGPLTEGAYLKALATDQACPATRGSTPCLPGSTST